MSLRSSCPMPEPARRRNLIQSISQSLTSLPPLAGNESIQASFGIAELDRHRPDYKDLLARADAAMYSDKRE